VKVRPPCRNVGEPATQIDETPAEIRHMVLLQFRKNNHVTDPRIVELLIQQGEMELQETRQQWKQRGHLMALIKPEVPPPDPLVDCDEMFRRFLDGSLTEGSIWRDHNPAEQARLLRKRALHRSARKTTAGPSDGHSSIVGTLTAGGGAPGVSPTTPVMPRAAGGAPATRLV